MFLCGRRRADTPPPPPVASAGSIGVLPVGRVPEELDAVNSAFIVIGNYRDAPMRQGYGPNIFLYYLHLKTIGKYIFCGGEPVTKYVVDA